MFATIGDDNKFKLWREDPSQAPLSGRKYRCIFSQSPSNHVSYVSLDFKTVRHQVWLAIVTHDGLLSLMEPSELESLSAWKTLDAIYPFGQHVRGSEPNFRLSLHQSERPYHRTISVSLDPRALSLAVAANALIKVFCAVKPDESNYQFCELLEMNTTAPVINDLSWAPGTLRQSDLIAAACDDGCVRIFELTTLHPQESFSIAGDSVLRAQKEPPMPMRNARSGIGAGLAGASRATTLTNSNELFKLDWKELCVLIHDEDLPVRRVQWVNDGKTLSELFTTDVK